MAAMATAALALSAPPAAVRAPLTTASSRAAPSTASWACRTVSSSRKCIIVRAMADESVTEKVKDVAGEMASAAENAAVDLETQAGKVASQGEEAAKSTAGTAKDAVGGKADHVETIRPMDKAPDGKDYLSGPTREFSGDATRDEANQEEGPGSDPVPKDGPL